MLTKQNKFKFFAIPSVVFLLFSFTNSQETSAVDFGELQVETSWMTKDKKKRDKFLAKEVDDKEWMDVTPSGSVKLKCLAPDGHRTELKEKPGDENPLTVYRNMNYTARLVDIPENGVTIAQIHNRGGVKRPWIRVYVDYDRKIKIKATKTTPDQKKSTYDKFVGPQYTAGEEFNIGVEVKNGEAHFSIQTNGESFTQVIKPSSDWNNYVDDYYLKAGVYTEGDDVEPEIEFIRFSITY